MISSVLSVLSCSITCIAYAFLINDIFNNTHGVGHLIHSHSHRHLTPPLHSQSGKYISAREYIFPLMHHVYIDIIKKRSWGKNVLACARILILTWWKNPKNRKLKLCSLFGHNLLFNVLTLTRINHQCSKLNTYLVTIFQIGGIVFTLKFHWDKATPQHSEPLKLWAQWCYIFLCTFVNIEWPDQLTL